MHYKTCFGGNYIPWVSIRFTSQPPPTRQLYLKTAFGEHFQHKAMESVFANILTNDRVIITKLQKYQASELLHNGVKYGTNGA